MEKEIAQIIIDHLNTSLPIEIFMIVAPAIAALGVFLYSYLKKLGENYASKEDIHQLIIKTESLTKAAEETRLAVKEKFDDRQLGLQHRMHQEIVLHEATRLVARFSEIFKNQPDEPGDFADDYSRTWTPQTVSRNSLENSKRDTCVYRFFRFLSAIEKYQNTVSGISNHSSRDFFDFYINLKLLPALASGQYPGGTVIWRDAAMELGEMMTERSDKWENTQPISWSNFVSIIQKENRDADIVNFYSCNISKFIAKKNVRLAIFSLLLIDFIQDNRKKRPWERERNHILKYISEKADHGQFSIWGKTTEKKNDWEVMDINSGKVPRNILSPFFDPSKNLGYPVKLPKNTSD
ncbi:MAG: hypothetical protein QM682_18230 [Paracoccus sp. (in: a-proteobacteria)]|uniref:hypothetical protein n=1 Tax=Paracoccus sp. TaxID=267 RepID=UPI0039E6380D